MFTDNTIANRVMATIKARIEAKQKQYNEGCEEIVLEAEQKKFDLADKLVQEILG